MMRYVLAILAILAMTALAWPTDDHVLVNHFDPDLMQRYWDEAVGVGR
jgi:hypothetical protein